MNGWIMWVRLMSLSLGMSEPEVSGRSVQEATLVSATDHFALYSDPWINLHHFLS